MASRRRARRCHWTASEALARTLELALPHATRMAATW